MQKRKAGQLHKGWKNSARKRHQSSSTEELTADLSGQAKRVGATDPQTAPASCPNCADETDCSNVRQCRAVEEAYAAPADAERLALATKLRVAAKIAGNPVHDDIMRAAEYLEKLRAGGWRGATCKELLQVADSSAPHTDKEG